jgi:Mrp family chromosome partitioning ATPase
VEHDRAPTFRPVPLLVRHGFLIASATAVLAAGATYLLSLQVAPAFVGEASLIAGVATTNHRDAGDGFATTRALDLATYQFAIGSRPVLAEAYRIAYGRAPSREEVDALERVVSVRSVGAPTAAAFQVIARHEVPDRASDLANAVALAAVRWDEHRADAAVESGIDSLQAQIEALEVGPNAATSDGVSTEIRDRTRTELQLQLAQLRALRGSPMGRLELFEPAAVSPSPATPRPARNALSAALIAAAIVLGLAALHRALDARLRGSHAIARATGAPVLAEFPSGSSGRRGVPADAAAYLRTGVGLETEGIQPKVILVTAAFPGHGASTVSVALAESFARLRERTILLDANLRRPALGREYDLSPFDVPPLRDALEVADPRPEPARVSLGHGAELDVVPSYEPTPDACELLATGMPELLARLRPYYDVVIIDSAAVLPVADSLTIVPHCSGVVMAVSAPYDDPSALSDVVELLRRAKARLIGTVLTSVDRAGRWAEARGNGSGYGDASYDAVAPSAVTHVHLGPTRRATSSAAHASGLHPWPTTAWASATPAVVASLSVDDAVQRSGDDGVAPEDLIDDSVHVPRPTRGPGKA